MQGTNFNTARMLIGNTEQLFRPAKVDFIIRQQGKVLLLFIVFEKWRYKYFFLHLYLNLWHNKHYQSSQKKFKIYCCSKDNISALHVFFNVKAPIWSCSHSSALYPQNSHTYLKLTLMDNDKFFHHIFWKKKKHEINFRRLYWL